MRLTRLQVKNYKSLRDIDIDIHNRLNVIIGKNDAGKSNILTALDILFNSELHCYEPMEEISDDLLETTLKGNAQYCLFDRRRLEAEITAHLKISKHKLEKMGLKADETATLVFSKKVIIGKGEAKIIVDFLRLNKDIIIKTPDEEKRFLQLDGKYSENLEGTIAEKILKRFSNEFIFIPADRNIIRDPSFGSEKLKAADYIKDSLINLANSKDEDSDILFEQFGRFISTISPIISKVETVKENGKVTDLKFSGANGEDVPLSTIGGGNNELLLLLHEIILSGGKILAIEEPEIHLHPEAERKLYQFMKEFSQATQMFVTTHETVFVQPDNINALFRVVKKEEVTQIYSMTAKDYIDKDRLRQELNSENCEMFFADKVLLVEGISDKMMMEGLIKRYCRSAQEIKVVTAFSKDNFEIYLDLLKIFRISYLVMTDLDALKGRFQIKVIWRELKGKDLKGRYERIEYLKKRNIYVLSKGALEQSYPRKYRRGLSKPLDALYALYELTDEEYRSPIMKDLREVVEALEK